MLEQISRWGPWGMRESPQITLLTHAHSPLGQVLLPSNSEEISTAALASPLSNTKKNP